MDFWEEQRAQLGRELLLFGGVGARLQPFDDAGQARVALPPRFQTFANEHQHGLALAGVDRNGDALDLGGDVRGQRDAEAGRLVAPRPAAGRARPRARRCALAHDLSMTHCAAH